MDLKFIGLPELETIGLSSVVNVLLQHINNRSYCHYDTLTTEGAVYNFRSCRNLELRTWTFCGRLHRKL